MPLQFPRVKIAMLMRAYRKPPNRTWCPPPEPAWNQQAKTYAMPKLEAVLHYFQWSCKPAVAGMQSWKLAALTANVACAAADAFIMCKEREKEGDAMMSAVAKHLDEIKVFAASMARDPPPKPEQAWMDFDEVKQRNKAKTAVAVNTEPAKLMPNVIMYDAVTGVPQNAQDVRAATGQEAKIATVPWADWLRGRIAHALCEKTNHIAAIQLVLNALHTRGHIDQAPIDIIIDLSSKRKVVKASEDLPKGTLALPPCVPKTSSVLDKSVHPHRVPIVVTEKSAVADGTPPGTRLSAKSPCEAKRTVYYVHPEFKMPEESKEKLEDAVASHVRAWEFNM